MSKIVLLRIMNDGSVVALHIDGALSIPELKKIQEWSQDRINDEMAMSPKYAKEKSQ